MLGESRDAAAARLLRLEQEKMDKGASLVRIPPPTWVNERGREKEEEDGGPAEIRTPDPRHVKAVS